MAAAAANSSGGSSQPAATGSPLPGPGDEAGGARDPAATFGAADAAAAANTCPTVRTVAAGSRSGSSESPAATRSAAGSPEERDPTLREVLSVLWRSLACYQSLPIPTYSRTQRFCCVPMTSYTIWQNMSLVPHLTFSIPRKSCTTSLLPNCVQIVSKLLMQFRKHREARGCEIIGLALLRWYCCGGASARIIYKSGILWSIQEFLLDSYQNCTVAKAWFHINSVLEDGTIMQT